MTPSSESAIIRRQAERISVLEEELRQARETCRAVTTPREWDLTRAHQRVLLAILHAPGGFLASDAVRRVLRHADDSVAADPTNCVRTQIHYMRKKLAPFGIQITTRWGLGYELPAASRAAVRAAIQERQAA